MYVCMMSPLSAKEISEGNQKDDNYLLTKFEISRGKRKQLQQFKLYKKLNRRKMEEELFPGMKLIAKALLSWPLISTNTSPSL